MEQTTTYALRLLGAVPVVEETSGDRTVYVQFRTSADTFAYLRDHAGPDAERILKEFLDGQQKYASGLSA